MIRTARRHNVNTPKLVHFYTASQPSPKRGANLNATRPQTSSHAAASAGNSRSSGFWPGSGGGRTDRGLDAGTSPKDSPYHEHRNRLGHEESRMG